MKKYVYLFQALLFSVSAFCTDISRIKFEYLTVDDGLSQGTIEDILQDRQGMMWFATRDGLDRYDGQKFTIFRNNSNDPNSLASNWVLSLALDASGKIWIGSGGLNVYDPVLDKIIRIRPPWYRTFVAIALFILVLGYVIYTYIKEREIRTIYDKKSLQLKIDESQAQLNNKVKELEKQQEELQRRDEAEKNTRFLMEGVARMSDIIAKKRRNLEDLATGFIAELVQYIDASAGDVFIADDSDPTHVTLMATGEFSFSTGQERKFVINSGEGYVGTCYKEMKSLTIDNLPDDYVILRSGLGEISLHHVILVPLVQDNVCVGVIEIASIDKMEEHKIQFIEKIAESLASVVTIIKANEKSNMMLEQNNIQAEELHAQEEEMRQNLEELMATQETSQKHTKVLEEELRLKTAELNALQEEFKVLKAKKAGA